MNKQGVGKIDYTDYTLNPLPGCLHGCEYCYMNRMEKRFPGIMTPKVRLERLKALNSRKLKSGDKVFVGSSGDMWGDWVSNKDISDVLHAADERPDIIFQFLTKNPKKYSLFNFEDRRNFWMGTTVDGTQRTQDNLYYLIKLVPKATIKFVSFEPLLESPMISSHFDDLGWIIIGADSTRGAKKPPKKWADFLIAHARDAGIPVWVKDNYGYGQIIKEFPI